MNLLEKLQDGSLDEVKESVFRRFHDLTASKPFKFEYSYPNSYGNHLFFIATVNEVPPYRYFSSSYGIYQIHQDHFLYNLIDEGRLISFLTGDEDFLTAVYFNELNPKTSLVNTFCDLDRAAKESLLLLKEGTNAYLFYETDLEKLKVSDKKNRKTQEEAEKIQDAMQKKTIQTFSQKYFAGEKIQDDDKSSYVENNILVLSEWRLTFTKPVSKIFPVEYILDISSEISEEVLRERVRINLSFSSLLRNINVFNAYWTLYKEKIFHNTEVDRKLEIFSKVKDAYLFGIEKMENGVWRKICDFSLTKKDERWQFFGENIPARKVYFALTTFGNRIEDFDETSFKVFLKGIRRYTAEQLRWLNGIGLEVSLPQTKNRKKDFEINVVVSDKETNWLLEIPQTNFKRTANHGEMKSLFDYYSSYPKDFYQAYEKLSGIFGDSTELQEYFIGEAKEAEKKRIEVLKRSKNLFEEFLNSHQDKIVLRQDGSFIVKGKLKNYRMFAHDENVRVEIYPSGAYCCINAKTREGKEYTLYDKFIQYGSALMNDANLREEVHTLR
jgi:hypothetical protein